jgi:hypothetical protein
MVSRQLHLARCHIPRLGRGHESQGLLRATATAMDVQIEDLGHGVLYGAERMGMYGGLSVRVRC